MIIAQRKPLNEIMNMLEREEKVLILGCRECVTVCFAGGEREVAEISSALRIGFKNQQKKIEIFENSIQRQCENEFFNQIESDIKKAGTILSLACGVGVQTVIECFPEVQVFPGVNTTFYGRPTEQGVWREYCAGCGNCILHLTEGICPIARCSKSLLNGPCGGSSKGKCEVDPVNIDCAWQLIYDRLKQRGKLENLTKILPPKDWSTSAHGGVRMQVREDLRINS